VTAVNDGPLAGRAAREPPRGLVSVLIPCFNAERTLGEALESVFGQTWPHIEAIVIDDGSTDRSGEIARRFWDQGIVLCRQWNRGAAAARNRALTIARGEYCVFLDADDIFEPRFVATQVRAIIAAESDICFGQAVSVWPDGRAREAAAMPPAASLDCALSRVLSDGWLPPHAILWRTSFARTIGGWDATLRRNDDGEFIARALLSGPAIACSRGPRAIYRQHDGPDRISRRRDWSAIESSVAIIERLDARVSGRPHWPLSRRSVARHAHELASEAYFLGFDDLGARAEIVARRSGALPPLPRTLLHNLGVAVFGLRNKARLSRAKSKLPGIPWRGASRSRFDLLQGPP
jgi:glycosyltransferase involved in cell wall biosynthesis